MIPPHFRASTPRIAPGDFGEVTRIIRKTLMKDANVAVITEAVMAAANLAKGLRRDFRSEAKTLVPALLDKLKDKTTNLVRQITVTLSAFHSHCVSLADMSDELLAAFDHKVPKVQVESLEWAAGAIAGLDKPTAAKLHKEFVPAVRAAAARFRLTAHPACFAFRRARRAIPGVCVGVSREWFSEGAGAHNPVGEHGDCTEAVCVAASGLRCPAEVVPGLCVSTASPRQQRVSLLRKAQGGRALRVASGIVSGSARNALSLSAPRVPKSIGSATLDVTQQPLAWLSWSGGVSVRVYSQQLLEGSPITVVCNLRRGRRAMPIRPRRATINNSRQLTPFCFRLVHTDSTHHTSKPPTRPLRRGQNLAPRSL